MKKIVFLITLLHISLLMWAQTKSTGVVLDQDGKPVISATVEEVGNEKNRVLTDGQGKFEITVSSSKAKIRISSVSFTAQTLPIGSFGSAIKLSNKEEAMEEVVVAYARQKKITNTGAVSMVSGSELRQTPSSNIQNTLAGRLPGLFQQQVSGQPGRDAANIFIRGVSTYASGVSSSPLVIVDDVEFPYSQLNQLDINEVESVSILKDASTTAVYGIKGANGVIVITTKRGKEGPAKVTFRSEGGFQKPTVRREPLPSHEALFLLREQAINMGQDPVSEFPNLYSDAALEAYKNHSDPYTYPNVNWYDEVLKKSAFQQKNNLDITGGGKNMRYFLSLGQFYQNGILKDIAKEEDFNSNYYLKRYNIRSNIDLDVNKDFSLKLDLSTRFNEINSPNLPDVLSGGAWPFWRRITSGVLTPWLYPVTNPDGSYGGKRGNVTLNPVGILKYAGYNRNYNTDLNLNLTANHKLDFITKGLAVRGLVALTNSSGFTRSLTRGRFPVYDYNSAADSYTPVFDDLLRLPPLSRGSSTNDPYRRVNLQGILTWNRQFGDHTINALALTNRATDIRVVSQVERAPENFQGYAMRLGYNFRSKYMIEFNAGYNGTDRFKAKNRYGLFPAVSLGWNLSEEKFFTDLFPFVDAFKIRGSYGIVGNDEVGGSNRYIYEEVYSRSTGAYYFGEVPTADERIYPGQLANEDVRWEKERKANIGVDMKLFRNKLSITADYFDNYRYDILTQRESVPLYTGLSLPPVNIGEVSNKGLELEIGYRGNITKELGFFTRANISYAKNKILFRDEPYNSANPLLARTGRPIGQIYGYTSLGFYADDKDIESSPVVIGRSVKPGDLKYADINNDGKIDQGDIGPIGYPNIPQLTFGYSLGFTYKGLDVSALLQGSAKGSMSASTMLQIGNVNGIPAEIHKKRWTPETAATAEYPRLGGVSFDNSTFWLRPTDYIRLKNVELGYSLPKKISDLVRLQNIRFYANGLNLVTFFKLKIYDIDPESLSGDGTVTAYSDYPQQKVVNFGLQVTF